MKKPRLWSHSYMAVTQGRSRSSDSKSQVSISNRDVNAYTVKMPFLRAVEGSSFWVMAQGSLVRLTFFPGKNDKIWNRHTQTHRLYLKAGLKGPKQAEAKGESTLEWQTAVSGI